MKIKVKGDIVDTEQLVNSLIYDVAFGYPNDLDAFKRQLVYLRKIVTALVHDRVVSADPADRAALLTALLSHGKAKLEDIEVIDDDDDKKQE